MRTPPIMLATAALLAAAPANALDRYQCSDNRGRLLTLEIDEAANTIKMADGSRPLASVCVLLATGSDGEATTLCHVRVAGDLAMADFPLRDNGNDRTTFAAFDRRDMTFQVLGRGPVDNLRLKATCKPG